MSDTLTSRMFEIVERCEEIYDHLFPDGSAHDPETLNAVDKIDLLLETLRYIVSLKDSSLSKYPEVPKLTYKELEVKLDDAVNMARRALKNG